MEKLKKKKKKWSKQVFNTLFTKKPFKTSLCAKGYYSMHRTI